MLSHPQATAQPQACGEKTLLLASQPFISEDNKHQKYYSHVCVCVLRGSFLIRLITLSNLHGCSACKVKRQPLETTAEAKMIRI